jgi:hypothetical protein
MERKQGKDSQEEKKRKGRPKNEVLSKEDALKKANILLSDYQNNRGELISEPALRRRINLLGTDPDNNQRWFSF